MAESESSFSGEFCNSGGISAKTLCDPAGVAVNSAGNLYVADLADQGNNRVLIYLTPLAKTAVTGSGDTIADVVLGQLCWFNYGACNSGGPSRYSLCGPSGVALDGDDNLYAADTDNSRVLEYDALTLSIGAAYPSAVFGQGGSFTAVLCNGGAIDTPTASSLCFPTHVATDKAGNLLIADSLNQRVLEYHNPLTTAPMADRVWGQFGRFTTALCNNSDGGARAPVNASSLCNPAGLAVDGADNLYVADAGNNRVLRYGAGSDANGVLGQMLLSTGSANLVDGRGFSMPDPPSGIAIEHSVKPNRVYVVDQGNNRVLAWSSVNAFMTHAPADLVFGQGNPFTSRRNQGEQTPAPRRCAGRARWRSMVRATCTSPTPPTTASWSTTNRC